MEYYTLRQIQELASPTPSPIYENKRRALSSNVTVFLSHSHKDKDIIYTVISFLLSMNIHIYVDWLDDSMPTVTSKHTAEKIKGKIKDLDKFVVLLTENSKNSKWVPWELGYADGVKNIGDIAILPILRESINSISGLEYMELYPQIKEGVATGKRAPAVFPPLNISQKGKFLGESWLNQKNTFF